MLVAPTPIERPLTAEKAVVLTGFEYFGGKRRADVSRPAALKESCR